MVHEPLSEPEDLRRWRLPRGRHGLPRELVERSQRERLLAAVVRVTVEKGYEKTTVGDILGEAGVGRESFYELFEDKLDCMLAAHKILVDHIEELVRDAYIQPGPWSERVRNTLESALQWFASDPEASHFLLIEFSTIGPAFRESFQTTYTRFIKLIDEGLDEDGLQPQFSHATSLGVGAMLARIYEEIVLGRATELPRLVPDLTQAMLTPYIGEERARAVAAGKPDPGTA